MALLTSVDFTKDPGDALDYSFNWSRWLQGDTITAFTVTASPGIVVDSTTFTATSSTAYLSGGVEGQPYDVTHTITLASGKVKNLTMHFRVLSK